MSTQYLTTDELAARIKYDARTIRDRLKDSVLLEGIKRPLPEMTPETISEFAGLSDAEIARRLSVSVSYIRRARIKMEKGSQQ